MIFKAIGNLIIAAVAFQLVPGAWTEVAVHPGTATVEIVSGVISWENELPAAKDVAAAALPQAASVRAPQRTGDQSLGVVITAPSAIVADLASGKILFEKNPDNVRSIASITKLMTALIFLEKNQDMYRVLEIKNRLDIGNNDFYAGEKVGAKDLLYSALIGSDNTAAENLALSLEMSKDEFVEAMNAKAAEMGLEKTHFADPVGLGSGNRSTALEVTKILKEAFDYDDIRQAAKIKSYEFYSTSGKYHYIKNTDELLSSFINQPPYSIVAAKTGSLPAAGYCLAMAVENEGNAIIIVSLGSRDDDSRFQDVKSLAWWTFSNYKWQE
ncbi:MAG: serine hydrolase [Patescibacteria group bacterium]|nr:serine hydrolase [Patescibacteria group bacterium]